MAETLSSKEKTQRLFARLYIIMVCISWLFTISTYLYADRHTTGFYVICLQLGFNIYTLFMVFYMHLTTIKKLLPIYIVLISLLSFPSLLLNSYLHYNQSVLWALMNGACLVVIYPNRKAIYWNIFIFLQVIVAQIISEFWGSFVGEFMDDKDNWTLTFLLGNNFSLNTVLIGGVMLLVVVHLVQYINAQETDFVGLKLSPKEAESEEETYASLYKQIIDCFEQEKPYLKCGFTISDLAVLLNTNVSYISKAIKQNRKMNFNAFLNVFRIRHAQKLLEGEEGKAYTLQYIYMSSGFNSQPTFNRSFKELTGFTPSEYLAHLEKM